MIWTAGVDRRCDYLNQRWLEFTGRRLEDELGWGWAQRIHPEDREGAIAIYNAAFDERRPFDLEYRLQRADGEYRWVLDTAVPRTDTNGEFAGYIGCCTDVTERRALEQRVKRMERTDAIAQLARGVAHEFNNLVTGILGYVSLLLEDGSLSPNARDDLAQIQHAADRAAALTRQLLAFSRRPIVAPRVLDLNRVVSGTVSGIRGIVGSRIDVVQVLAPDLEPVLADPGQLEQVLLHLSSNARDAMPDGGRLELRTGRAQVDSALAARHAGLAPGAYVTLSVRDTGRGLDPSALEETGLGLAPVYGTVRQSGGYVAVESAPERGTTFTLYLRRSEGVAAPDAAGETAGVLAGTGTVLLVEDEEQVRELARRVLERAGYTVLTAIDAESAAAVADRHPGHIHLLVTDMVLPRVSGRELAARLGIHRPAIKVLYVSGTSDDAIARHRMLEPGTEFLEKPFSLDGLLRKVQQVLGAPEPDPRPV
jgi:PAS domain S-box-containing protein